jgi:hypothetical protein
MTFLDALLDVRLCHVAAYPLDTTLSKPAEEQIVDLVAKLSTIISRYSFRDLDDLDLPSMLELYSTLPDAETLDSLRCIFKYRVLPNVIRRCHFIGFDTSVTKHGLQEVLRFKLNDIGKDLFCLADPTSTRSPITGVVVDEVLP